MSAEPFSALSERRMEELLSRALRPVRIEVRVAPGTLERSFVLYFDDQPPIAIVMNATLAAVLRAETRAAQAKAMN
jgi:hypothetical protein